MAYSGNNRYYQYETSPRKLKPEYEPIKKKYPKKSTARKSEKKNNAKQNKKMQIKIISYIVICFIALFIISYRYSLIDDTYASLKEEKAELASLEKETRQLEAIIESNINLSNIEEEAKSKLGMQKLNSEQIIYVTLPKTNHVETNSDEIKDINSNDNWFMQFIEKIINNLK